MYDTCDVNTILERNKYISYINEKYNSDYLKIFFK